MRQPSVVSVRGLRTLALLLALLPALAAAGAAKNVILMIADGTAWGSWDLASYWQYGVRGRQPYDGFPVRLGMTTYPLNTSETPTGDATPMVGYDPAQAWDSHPSPGGGFAGYRYLGAAFTDSAAAATAMATGTKTYNSAIDHDNRGRPLPFVTATARSLGKATGVVTSVPFTHATPAAFGAQNASRNHYGEIGRQLVGSGTLDLIMGAGNPLYDANGQPRATPAYANETGSGGGFIARSTWDALFDGSAGWQLIQTKAEFQGLADGTLPLSGRPLIGVPRVYDTLQANRTTTVFGTDPANPSGTAFNPAVPSLATMTRGALRYLERDPDGLFLMVEGGAVDWAAHGNATGRVIEELVDFNAAVQVVVDWVQTRSSWSETLLIVLTDHGTGMPMGPDSDSMAFQPIQNNGVGKLPGVRWHTGHHTNEITLLRAIGAGSPGLLERVTGSDPGLQARLGFNDGRYLDNTAVYQVMTAAMGTVPLPGTLSLGAAGLPLLWVMARRRRPSRTSGTGP